MQFKGTTISFNGVNSTKYGLYLCNVGQGLDRQMGVNRSFTMENGNLISVTDDSPTFDIQLIKLDKHSDPAPITDADLFEIKRWLYSPKDFKPLIIDRQPVVYYGMFVMAMTLSKVDKQMVIFLLKQKGWAIGAQKTQNFIHLE